jgi:hypothetical protein
MDRRRRIGAEKEEGVSRRKAFLAIIALIVAVLLSGCAEGISSFLNPRTAFPGSLLFVGHNEDTGLYEMRKHNIATGNTEVVFVLPEFGLHGKDMELSAFDYSEKHKTLIIDWWFGYPMSNEAHTLKTYVRDEEGRYAEDRTLFEGREGVAAEFSYFNYVEQIDRLCVSTGDGIDFINLETGETDDRLQLSEGINDRIAFDWNEDFTELVYNSYNRFRAYLYDTETGASQRIPSVYGTPQFALGDSLVIGNSGADSGHELDGEVLFCYDPKALKTVWKTNIKDSIEGMDVSPDGNHVAVMSYKFGWIVTPNKYRIYIVDASTGKKTLKLLEGEAAWEGVKWIADQGK